MASARLWNAFEIDIAGVLWTSDQKRTDAPLHVALTGPVSDQRRSIAAAATWDAWTSGAEEPMTDFDFLWIISDLAGVQVELTVDKDGDNGLEVLAPLTLIANYPLVLADDASLANYTADFGGGTADVIDQIRIHNPTGASAAANVRMLMAT